MLKTRVAYLEELMEKLTSRYLKMIVDELCEYYGPRSGNNAMVAASLADHFRTLAFEGSSLDEEKELVVGVCSMCYGGCGNIDEPKISDETQKHLGRLIKIYSQGP